MPDTLPFPAPMPSADPTVREIIGFYLALEVKIETRRSKRAWQERERILRRFIDVHGDLHVSQCRKAHLKVWIETNPKLKSDWTRGRHAAAIHRAFNWAADDMELIAKNPFKGVRYRQGKRGRPLTEAEYRALVAATDRVFAPIVHFCWWTGARPHEAREARWQDIHGDLDAGRAWIVVTEHKTSHLEGAKPRVLGLAPAAVDVLLAIRRSYLPGLAPETIFLNKRGRPWTRYAVSLRIRRLRKKTGLPRDAKLYGTRHAFATQAIVNGVDIRDVAELLGHSSTRMTEHYLHLAGMHERLCDLAAKATGAAGPRGIRDSNQKPASAQAGPEAGEGVDRPAAARPGEPKPTQRGFFDELEGETGSRPQPR